MKYAVWRVISRSCSTASARRGHEIARSPLPDGVAARYLIPLGVTCIDEGRHSHSRIKVPADIVKSSNVLPASSLRRSTHKHGRQRQRSGDWAAQRTVPAGSHGWGQRQNRSCQTVRNSGHKGDLAATHRCRYVGIGVLTQSRKHVMVIYLNSCRSWRTDPGAAQLAVEARIRRTDWPIPRPSLEYSCALSSASFTSISVTIMDTARLLSHRSKKT